MSIYIRNVLQAMSRSQSQKVAQLAYGYQMTLERFLCHVHISRQLVMTMLQGEDFEANDACQKVFRNGWLSPDGAFTKVEYTKHENSVYEVTGHRGCDDACDHGWLKFMAGNPYNHDGESVFNEDVDRSKMSASQKAWLNEWLVSICEPEAKRPTF